MASCSRTSRARGAFEEEGSAGAVLSEGLLVGGISSALAL